MGVHTEAELFEPPANRKRYFGWTSERPGETVLAVTPARVRTLAGYPLALWMFAVMLTAYLVAIVHLLATDAGRLSPVFLVGIQFVQMIPMLGGPWAKLRLVRDGRSYALETAVRWGAWETVLTVNVATLTEVVVHTAVPDEGHVAVYLGFASGYVNVPWLETIDRAPEVCAAWARVLGVPYREVTGWVSLPMITEAEAA